MEQSDCRQLWHTTATEPEFASDYEQSSASQLCITHNRSILSCGLDIVRSSNVAAYRSSENCAKADVGWPGRTRETTTKSY